MLTVEIFAPSATAFCSTASSAAGRPVGNVGSV